MDVYKILLILKLLVVCFIIDFFVAVKYCKMNGTLIYTTAQWRNRSSTASAASKRLLISSVETPLLPMFGCSQAKLNERCEQRGTRYIRSVVSFQRTAT